MPIIVNTNVTALRTQKSLNSATSTLEKSLERMSTGLKINRAGDDAAGLYVATGLNTQIRGSKVAQNNVETGNNVLSIMEGDLDVILDNLNRIRDLSVQAANSVYSEDAMTAMADEVKQRLAEINRVSEASNFNGLNLLNGDSKLSEQGLRLQVGANADEAGNCIKIGKEFFSKLNSSTLGAKTTEGIQPDSGITAADGLSGGPNFENVDAAFASASAAAQYINMLDTAINDISNKKATIGATMNRLDAAASSLTTTIENNTAAKSTIMDADIAAEAAEYTKAQILQQTSSALLVQANALPQIAISLVQG